MSCRKCLRRPTFRQFIELRWRRLVEADFGMTLQPDNSSTSWTSDLTGRVTALVNCASGFGAERVSSYRN